MYWSCTWSQAYKHTNIILTTHRFAESSISSSWFQEESHQRLARIFDRRIIATSRKKGEVEKSIENPTKIYFVKCEMSMWKSSICGTRHLSPLYPHWCLQTHHIRRFHHRHSTRFPAGVGRTSLFPRVWSQVGNRDHDIYIYIYIYIYISYSEWGFIYLYIIYIYIYNYI